MSRILLTGAAGNLGVHLLRQAPPQHEITAVWRHRKPAWSRCLQADLAEVEQVERLMAEATPELVIHTAYSQQDLERDVVQATENLTRVAASHGCRALFMSTDVLFDGTPGRLTEASPPTPIIPYGEAKARTETIIREHLPAAMIVRTSLIIGTEPLNDSSAWIVEALRDHDPVTLFVDELRRPLAAEDLAAMIWEIVALPPVEAAGIWHLAGPELLSRFAIGLLLARRFGLSAATIRPVLSAASQQSRPRVLDLATDRADRQLRHRPRTISQWLAWPESCL